ncbi:MAG: hypothetical protein H7A33_05095 [Deltaproteobacteria bacterium]|nr:hypothetical protein [Deltaproteobacteria bacterium]
MRFLTLILGFVFCLLSSLAFAQAIPLDNLNITIEPQEISDSGAMGQKSIRVDQNARGVKISWYSLVKELDKEAYYPTYKIRARRGIMEVDGFEGKVGFFQPILWGNGYLRLDTVLPLWLPPEVLNLKGRQRLKFNAGIIGNRKVLLKAAPDAAFEQMSFIDSLYRQYVNAGEPRGDLDISRSERKRVKDFVDEFFEVQRLAKVDAELQINGSTKEFPALVIGNDYFQFVVIDDPLNPLVLSFKLFPKEAPRFLRKIFKAFKKDVEFRVTQIQY